MSALVSHNKAESLLAIHFHINQLLHIETYNIIFITIGVEVYEHGLPIMDIGQIFGQLRLWS